MWVCFELCCLLSMWFAFFVFFFSSRRRHTRSLCDWSSDVCSSDLTRRAMRVDPVVALRYELSQHAGKRQTLLRATSHENVRSEERRVGKECRSRRSQYQ